MKERLMQRLGFIRLAVLGYMILAIATGGAFYATWDNTREVERSRVERIHQINTVNQKQCSALRNLYAVIQQTLIESDKRIDAIDYYRSHAAERRLAHKANAAIIARFQLPPCPRQVTVG